jgi:hypothetical protein
MGTYRFYAQLQKGRDNLATSAGTFDHVPTCSEAVEVVGELRSKGKLALNRKAHNDFESAIDAVLKWLENGRNSCPPGNGDISAARETFTYSGESYRVDIGTGGETTSKWFV